MTRALTMFLVLALPALAEEKKSTDTTTPAATTTAAPAPQAAQPDSPLVAAAKRANRLGKKPANVITNATLKTSGTTAHVTTTATQAAIQMPKPLDPPRETPEMAAARVQQEQRAKAAEQAAAAKKAKDEQQRKTEAAAAATEEGYDGMQDDASEFVGQTPPPQF